MYDKQPIVDYFRWAGEDEVAGMMVVEGDRQRYFFKIKRVGSLSPLRPDLHGSKPDLPEVALRRLLIRPPAQNLGSVPEAAASDLIKFDFHH